MLSKIFSYINESQTTGKLEKKNIYQWHTLSIESKVLDCVWLITKIMLLKQIIKKEWLITCVACHHHSLSAKLYLNVKYILVKKYLFWNIKNKLFKFFLLYILLAMSEIYF